MKLLLLASIAATLLLSNTDCNGKKDLYKGRLEIKGICMNYTIALLEGELDTSKYETSWTDEHTGKSYTNVFRLDQPCNFPDTLDVRDEFYFSLDTVERECTVCLAYYPVPRKGAAIEVVAK